MPVACDGDLALCAVRPEKAFIRPLGLNETKQNQEFVHNINALIFAADTRKLHKN